jgi:hypothetical protein
LKAWFLVIRLSAPQTLDSPRRIVESKVALNLVVVRLLLEPDSFALIGGDQIVSHGIGPARSVKPDAGQRRAGGHVTSDEFLRRLRVEGDAKDTALHEIVLDQIIGRAGVDADPAARSITADVVEKDSIVLGLLVDLDAVPAVVDRRIALNEIANGAVLELNAELGIVARCVADHPTVGDRFAQ